MGPAMPRDGCAIAQVTGSSGRSERLRARPTEAALVARSGSPGVWLLLVGGVCQSARMGNAAIASRHHGWNEMLQSNLRVVSWNLNARGPDRTHEFIRHLSAVDPDVVLLQEVTRSMFGKLKDGLGPEGTRFFVDGRLSTDVGVRLDGRRWGTAVMLRRQWRIHDAYRLPDNSCYPGDLVDGLPFKAVMAEVELQVGEGETRTVTFVSAHARPASGKQGLKSKKPAFHAALARWATTASHPVVLGIDANTPNVDHPDPAKVVYHWPVADQRPHELDQGEPWGEDLLLDPRKMPRLRDAYREVVSRDDEVWKAQVQENPDGPLATSHVLRGGRHVRYDHLLVDEAIRVIDCAYDQAPRHEKVSDHAMLMADLKVS